MIYLIALALLIIALVSSFLLLTQIFKKNDDTWKRTVRGKLMDLQNSQNMNQESKLMQLDKLFEYCLQKVFHNNLSLGAMLKSKSSKFTKSELDDIWLAHKTRNRIAHDINYNANNNYKEMEKSIQILTLCCKKWSL